MIGKMIKYMRTTRNLKQDEIAAIINSKSNTISQYENNNRQATFDVIEKIANYCEFEIVFRDTKSKEEYTLKDIDRKI